MREQPAGAADLPHTPLRSPELGSEQIVEDPSRKISEGLWQKVKGNMYSSCPQRNY